jgi:SAM-dependent methyltransferase
MVRDVDHEVKPFETVDCDFCGSGSYRQIYHFDVSNQVADIVECSDCGLCYLSPRPAASALPEFYGENYYSYSLSDDDVRPSFSLKDRLKFTYMNHHLGYQLDAGFPLLNVPRSVSRYLKPFIAMPRFKPQGRLLDMGCGAGEKLLEFKAFGWSVNGVELSDSAAQAGARKGLDIRTGRSLDPPFPDASFDAVTFYHSLEHLPSPRHALTLAHRLLKPGGQILISVPNFGSLERRIFGKDWAWMEIPIHFYHFTKPSLASIVRDAGFKIETVGDSFSGQSVDRSTNGLLGPLSRIILRFAGPFGVMSALCGTGKAIILTATKHA